jgi:hypothetical protein
VIDEGEVAKTGGKGSFGGKNQDFKENHFSIFCFVSCTFKSQVTMLLICHFLIFTLDSLLP